MSLQNHPRYGKNPVYLFFEAYIQNVLGVLPQEKFDSIQGMNLQKVFSTRASVWTSAIEETLHLSNTIDIAILDLWYRNRDQFKTESDEYDPIWFSQLFIDEYLNSGSQIDVWPEGALEAATERIKQAQSTDNG